MIERGDPAPWFTAPSSTGPRYQIDLAAGRYLVLVFVDSDEGAGDAVVRRLAGNRIFDDRRAALFIVTADGNNEASEGLPLRIPGVRAIYDTDREVAAAFGVTGPSGTPLAVLVSPRMQVLRVEPLTDETSVDALLNDLRRLPAPGALPPLMAHAPVLMVPHVFERALCEELINGYRRHGGQDSGFMREIDGRTVPVLDRSHKVRRDWEIKDPALIDIIQDRFARRVAPEIRKVFQFNATRMERYVVACYSADSGGHFAAHRDNTTRGTAHRRFAVSLNLNAEEFEGGDLRFSEFGQRPYRAPTGGGIVFSCSLLHEAAPVTRGERFVFLPFLYDEAARRVRDANTQYLDVDEIRTVDPPA